MSESGGIYAHVLRNHLLLGEVAATDGLCFLLNEYPTLRAAFQTMCSKRCPLLPQVYYWATEVLIDGWRADLVGYSRENKAVVVIEAKFWSPLGEGQPSAYRQLLNPNSAGLLALMVPAVEEKGLMEASLAQFPDAKATGHDSYAIDSHHLASFNWHEVVAGLTELGPTGAAADDLGQWSTAIDLIDSKLIQPFESGQSHPSFDSEAIENLTGIVRRITDELCGKGLADTTGLKWTETALMKGQYLRVPGREAVHLGIHLPAWSQSGSSPLWVRFWKPDAGLRKKLHQQYHDSQIGSVEADGHFFAPIPLLEGKALSEQVSAATDSFLESQRHTPELPD